MATESEHSLSEHSRHLAKLCGVCAERISRRISFNYVNYVKGKGKSRVKTALNGR